MDHTWQPLQSSCRGVQLFKGESVGGWGKGDQKVSHRESLWGGGEGSDGLGQQAELREAKRGQSRANI